ncbi:hypothetical protein [Thermococcus stetteri]|uniref:hypothetical protein n=1 Tax=Thermococcus stetteri TaxID=49900 RepID=UPI001AE85C7A|nr:hypothetical protein [Thermococcus stetteri]MBP1912114.1 Holliday junction resolvase-like predicted endonuclease [Thermococcus stetteri]
MRWKGFLALTLVVLFLGMTVDGASAMASLINETVNSAAEFPQEFNPGKPGDEIRPQFWWIIGLILIDIAASWFLEHYVSPEVAAVYDAVTILIDPAKIAEKLGIKGAKLGIKVLSHNKVLIGLFKDGKVVKKITYASKETAEWVSKNLGKDYIGKIVEKYVVKNGGLRKGDDFDEIAKALRRVYELGITNGDARRFIVDKGWDVEKLEKVLKDVKNVEKGGSKLIIAINRDLKNQKNLGPLYEAEVVSHLKQSGWKVEEVEKEVVTSLGNTEIDIIVRKGSETVLIECKRSFGGVDPDQILAQAEYAKSKNIRKIYVYYSKDAYNPRIMRAMREAKSKYGVDIELIHFSSQFN